MVQPERVALTVPGLHDQSALGLWIGPELQGFALKRSFVDEGSGDVRVACQSSSGAGPDFRHPLTLATPSSHLHVEIRCRMAEERIRVEAASRGAVKDLLGRQVLAELVDVPA